MLLSNHSETERQHSADSSTSQEEIFLIQGEFTLPNPLTHDHFFLSSTACKKASSAAVCLRSIPCPPSAAFLLYLLDHSFSRCLTSDNNYSKEIEGKPGTNGKW